MRPNDRGEPVEGQPLTCRHCGKQIGTVAVLKKKEVIDQADELIRRGARHAAPCAGQPIELKATGPTRTYVPHFTAGDQRQDVSNSGKQPVPAAASSPAVPAAPSVPREGPGGRISALITPEKSFAWLGARRGPCRASKN